MFTRKSTILAFLFLFVWTLNIAQSKSLPRSNPEAEGVSSQSILDFIDAVANSKHEFHSIMVLRHGKVIAEAWWAPYRPDLKHTMYSVSKSFTSTAIGFAVSEKRLTVEDKVLSFFPEYSPDSVSPNLAELRVKDLLSMSVGQSTDPTGMVVSRDSNWVKGFLALPIQYKPGSRFLYNSLATYMLSAIVQKLTGQKTIDYLKPRLFDPLGITGMDWEIDPMGRNVGGWGLRVKTEDMAKFGLLYLQKGKWNGEQILPEAWIEEATTKKIDQAPTATDSVRRVNDWVQGYCYQFWRSRYNSYRGDGAFGQYILVWPEQDAVVIITSETSSMQGELDLVFKHLLPGFKTGTLPADKKTLSALKQRLASLSLPKPAAGINSSTAQKISGKTFDLASNQTNYNEISFKNAGKDLQVDLKSDKARYKISFASGAWKFGETQKLGPSLVARAKAHFKGLPPSKIAGSYRWKDENTLELTLRYIDSPHTETILCKFDQTDIAIDISNSFDTNPANKLPTIKGKME